MAKLAHGIADDLLTTTALATTAPIVIAPAMNVHMYENPATQENMRILRERGVAFVDAESGYLACGEVGKGRLADPAIIAQYVCDMLAIKRDLDGMKVLVTAGPTEEPIDSVRYISNPSSGKTGFALAEAAADRGADVVLVTGPVSLEDPAGVKVMRVRTALEMYDAVDDQFDDCDIAVFSAAVSDYRPAVAADRKLKKGEDSDKLAHIDLVENPDILASMGARKREGQVVVGFAAETDDVIENAREKLVRKNADIIVANLVGEGKGFGTDENEVTFVMADEEIPSGKRPKCELAQVILDRALSLLR